MSTPTPHHCRRIHRSFQTLAECLWPDAAWIGGMGAFAVLAHCDMLAITLCPSRGEADEHLARLDARPCCRACTGRHELVELVLRDDAPEARGGGHSHGQIRRTRRALRSAPRA